MNLSITDDITFRKLTSSQCLRKRYPPAEDAAHAGRTFVVAVRHKGLFGTRPDIKVTVAVGSTGTEACGM